MAFSLQEALEQIRSDKIKERQQGLEALEHIFSDLDNVYNLDPKQEGKAWLKTFQSLFACVLAEKAACIRKGSFSDAQPVALARLQRAAQMLRSLVEKAASLLTRKVVKALVTHILQMLNHRGTLLRPIAPAYTSALCAILKHQHHVDHLDPEDWWAASSLCFDILLGRDLDGTAAATKPEQWLASIPTPPSSRTDRRVLSLEDAVTAECLRHLMACTVAPLFGPDAYGVQLLADYTRFILTFSMESSAHLPAMTGLVILIEHLELNHTREVIYASLAMRHIIFALWNTKNHLLKIQLLLFLRNVSPLLASCATKQSEVGLPHDHPNFAALRIEAAAFLELAYETLLRDPDTRWGLEPLRLDALVFRWPQHPEAGSSRTPPALSNSAFYLGPYSAEQDTLAWCRFSLQIDLLEALVSLDSLAEENGTLRANHREGAADELPPSTATTSQPSNSPTKPSNGKRGLGPASSSPQKRRKMEATIRSFKVSWLRQLLNVITGAEQSSSQTTAARLCALQLLTFVVLTHPNLIRHDDDVGDGIQKQLLQLPVHTDVQLVSWSLVALGAIAMMYDTANTKITDSNFNFVQTPSGRFASSTAMQSLQLADTCRAAAFLQSILLVRGAIPEDGELSGISRFLAEVDLQGPPVICDSVCHLMTLILLRTTSDRRYQHLDPRRKIGAWFSSTYSPADAFRSPPSTSSARSSGFFLPYHDLHRLLDCIVTERRSDYADVTYTSDITRTDSVAELLRRREQLQPLRDLTLKSCIMERPRAEGSRPTQVMDGTPPLLSMESFDRMALVLEKKIEACVEALQGLSVETGSQSSITCQAAVSAMHVAMLVIDTRARSAPPSSSFRLPRIRYGCQVIIKTVDVASTSKSMRADEYSLVIEQLALLLPSDTSLRQVDPSSNSLLRHPGAASGIAANSLAHNLEKGRGTSLSTTADQSCERIWAAIRDADMLAKMLSCCEQVLERALLGDEESDDQPASAAAASSRDAFDDMPESGSSSTLRARTTVLQPYSQSTDVVVSIAVRLLSEVPRMLTGTADSQRDKRIVSLFFDSPVEAMISLAPALLRSRRNGTLWISQRDLVDALDRIGSELLTSYRLAKQPVARIAAVHAVSDAVPLLLEELDEQSDLFDKVQKLAIFFADQIGRTKWPAPWQVQLACADFLAECLCLDPESRICRSGSARGPTFSPLNALLQVNADADIRVRGLGSPIASTVFDKQSSNEAHVASIYSTFRDGLPSDSNIPQHILTRALSLCNVAIANSSVRRSSLFHLLEIVVATGMLPVTVQQLFAQVAARLGFAEASTCYQAFAAQITWGMATNAYDPLQLPWKVLGFASKRECLEATFASCGSMLLALQTPEGRTQFEALVHLTRRTRQHGLQECLPFLTAAYLGFAVEVGQKDGQPNLPGICEQALHELSLLGFAESDNHSELRQMITNADDLIVTTLLSLYHEPGADVAESWQSAVTALMQQDAIVGKILSDLTPATNGSAASLHEPSRPFFPAAAISAALSALPSLGIEPFRKDVTYNVLRHVFHQIASSRFVNDQLRLCAALRIYLAMCSDSFWTDQLNAHLLIKSIEQLLGQPHLHDDFRPILAYACNYSQVAEQSSEALVSCIIAWSAASTSEMAQRDDAGDWLLEAARAVAKSSPVATSATVLLWPVQVTSTELVAIEDLIDVDTLSFALDACPRMSLQMASLFRIRALLRRADKSQLCAFCRRSAWKLLERTADCRSATSNRSSAEAQSDVLSDIFAIVMSSGEAALIERKGRRGMGQGDRTPAETFLGTVDTSQISTLSAAAILAIHQLAQDLPLQQSYQAFETLRNIAAATQSSLTEAHSTKIPTTIKQELDRIRPGISPLVPGGTPPHADDLLDPDLLDTSTSSSRWICSVASLLCDLLFAARRQPIFRPIGLFVSTTAEAARALFPILLLCFTSTDIELGTLPPPRSNSKRRVSGRQSQPQEQGHVREFCCAAVAKHFEQVLESSTSDPACSEIIVKALLAVRSFRPMQEEPDTVCYWYNVDTNLLAQRCITCGMFSAAIFFVEHGAWQQGESPASGTPSVRTRTNLLHQAYMNIDDPDAFYGITDGDVRELLLKRLHHEGQWLRAFQYHAADFEASSSDGVRRLGSEGQSLRQSLSSLGFKRLFESVGPRSEAGLSLSIIPTSYYGLDAAGWDLPKAGSAVPSKGRNLDTVLQALRQLGAEQDADKALSVAIPSQLQALCSTPIESIAAMRAIEGELLSLGQVKDWRKACASLGPNEAVAHLRATWTRVDTDHHFDVTEKVLNTRQAVLQAARQRMSLGQIGDTLDGSAAEAGKVERSLLVLLSRQAREHEKLQKAINATARAERIESVIDDRTNIAREEFAAVLWEQNEHSPAIQLLSQIVDDLSVKISSPAPQKRRGARLLALLAQWRATARSQHPREIDRALFDPALKLIATSSASETATTLGDPAAAEEQSEIAYRWARFAEEHHRGSDLAEITRLRLYIDRRSEEIAQNQRECERTTSRTERGKLLQFQRQAEKMLRQDQTRLTELEASRTHFLHRSVAMYARALASADIHDDAVARLISLWFENAADASLNRLLTTSLTSIPSRKFVALMHQLSARLTEVSDSNDSIAPFQKNLAQLLLRMCQDHPFHCLYAIFALIKTGADDKAATQRPSPRNSLAPSDNLSSSPSPQVLRSTAAEKIWNHIKRRPALNKRIKAFEELCLAYVEWAEYDLTSRPDRYFQSSGSIKKGALCMPPSGELRLARMRNVDVPVATGRLEIDPTCRYESFVSIARYSDTFTTAGGLHLPKISECVGSDGKRYKQLFKRDDDLRQDAVMQQVFRVVNELLHADRRTRERHLTIRTYTVLPLGPQCGMLEFVTNTVPLGEVLLALHEKYRGNDLTPTQARAKIRDAQSLPAEVKLEAFLDVCERMRPALHYFFSDAQRMPGEWYETRLRYTRSVSTNSIVGHTLGLGDRHVSNILLDNKSGELVHIDFGVAFDQGKLLPIPELVPFRLTRDIVDGMGINGVEGTFRRCCEETLRVLRAHQDVIKTVLEVFRHDPLFAWTSNPIKVVQRQAEDESSLPAPSIERSRAVASGEARSTPAPTPTPTLTAGRGASSRSTTPLGLLGEIAGGIGTDTAELSADRAITSVMAKLSSSLSIEYTVNDLIQQAMDAGNLSAIFHGWQAAL